MATNALLKERGKENPRGRRRVELLTGAALLGLGMLLLAAAVAYQAYGRFARSDLDQLSFAIERPQLAGQGYELPSPQSPLASVSDSEASHAAIDPPSAPSAAVPAGVQDGGGSAIPGEATGDGTTPAQSRNTPPGTADSGEVANAEGRTAAVSPGDGTQPATVTQTQPDGTTASAMTDGGGSPVSSRTSDVTAARQRPAATGAGDTEPPLHAPYGTGPADGGVARAADPEPDPTLAAIEASKAELATYSPPTPGDLALAGAPATHIRIPAIGVDATIDELGVVMIGSSLAWETPNKVVGHIPTTAAAGVSGQGWYFGHLESPIKGEGNVFRRLPEIPRLAGDAPIYIFLETGGRSYAYQVYVTEVVYQDDLSITDSGKHDITLVTCTPRFYYDHRLLVTAALVGVKEA